MYGPRSVMKLCCLLVKEALHLDCWLSCLDNIMSNVDLGPCATYHIHRESHHKLKHRKISFVHNILRRYPIGSKCCTEHGNIPSVPYGPLTRFVNFECRDRFPRHRLQRKPLVCDPGMYHDTCVTHVPWCMSGTLTHGGGEMFPVFPVHAQPAILRIW